LLSYISAFGVHRQSDLSEKERHFCRDISCVLQFVSESLTNTADEAQFATHLQLANRWEESMAEMKNDGENHRMVLIYNIAHVSRELLVEAKGTIPLS